MKIGSWKKPNIEKQYIIGGGILLALIIFGIIVSIANSGKEETLPYETVITETVTMAETETVTEAPTKSAAELQAEKEAEEKARQEALIDEELDSYDNLGICRLKDGGFLNVREEPGKSAAVIGKFYNNSACDILETVEDGAWYHISSGGLEGYVKSDYIATGDEGRTLAKQHFAQRAIVIPDVLWIRQEPGTDAKVLGAVRKGERYEVLDNTDGWVKIEEGYISSEYVEIRNCLNEAREANEKQDVLSYYDNLGISNVNNYLNIRKSPGKNSEVIGKLPGDAGADILGVEDGWYKIRSGAVTGYVSADYLLTGDEANRRAIEKSTVMAIVSTGGGEGLNVRTGPGKDYQVWTSISNKERYPVLDKESGWVKIDLGDTDEDGEASTAWVSGDYVSVRQALNEAISYSESAAKNSFRQKVCNFGVKYCGNPYVWGGTSLTGGCDCSGFTMKVFANFGISLPHYSGAQAKMGVKVTTATMKPGDLIFYANKSGTINHVAIYIGNGQIVHAANRRSGIKISNYKYRTPVAIRNIIGQ